MDIGKASGIARVFILTLVVASVATKADAQIACDASSASLVTWYRAASGAATQCCDRGSTKAIKNCLKTQEKNLRGLNAEADAAFVSASLSSISGLKENCAMPDAATAICTDSDSVTTDSIIANVTENCCDRKQQGARLSCLNRSLRDLTKARSLLTSDFVTQVSGLVRDLKTNPACGKGGQKSACEVFRNNRDGQGGWVHKPVSDSNGSIVNLFPSSDSPRACRYEDRDGKLVRGTYSSGRTNGHRETIRPAGGGRCSSFPNNLVVSCQIGSKRVCYSVPDPCNRYD